MTGPGQRDQVSHALTETAAGRVWTATMAGGLLGDGRFSIRWEPLAGPDDGTLVIAQRAWPQPRPAWLSDATARIGDTLDLVQTAIEVANAAVPALADGVAIFAAERLLAGDEYRQLRPGQSAAVRTLATRVAAFPDYTDATRNLVDSVLILSPQAAGSQVLATGRPILTAELDREHTGRIRRYHHGEQVIASFSSYLVMPLAARGTVIGFAIFARTPASPAFHDGDVALAGELVSRAAVCIDNARLFQRERRSALALQRGLLPVQPQVGAELEIAHRYVPVGANVVGGDWYDIVPVSGGRVVLVVGDAMGHGPEAAAVMVQLRTAARTLADLELPPEQVLLRLDKMAGNLTTAPFATCVYTVIDPADRSCVVVRAGHLPPFLVLPAGPAELLDLQPGLPLGLGADSFRPQRFSLPAGATLALFTDGLVESRTQTIDRGLAALRQALVAATADRGTALSTACEGVTGALCGQGEDDLTLVLARIR